MVDSGNGVQMAGVTGDYAPPLSTLQEDSLPTDRCVVAEEDEVEFKMQSCSMAGPCSVSRLSTAQLG